jgi:hypothetical protein
MRVYLDLQAGTGEVPRQGERLGEILSIVFFCAGQGQQIFIWADAATGGAAAPGQPAVLRPAGHIRLL